MSRPVSDTRGQRGFAGRRGVGVDRGHGLASGPLEPQRKDAAWAIRFDPERGLVFQGGQSEAAVERLERGTRVERRRVPGWNRNSIDLRGGACGVEIEAESHKGKSLPRHERAACDAL